MFVFKQTSCRPRSTVLNLCSWQLLGDPWGTPLRTVRAAAGASCLICFCYCERLDRNGTSLTRGRRRPQLQGVLCAVGRGPRSRSAPPGEPSSAHARHGPSSWPRGPLLPQAPAAAPRHPQAPRLSSHAHLVPTLGAAWCGGPGRARDRTPARQVPPGPAPPLPVRRTARIE